MTNTQNMFSDFNLALDKNELALIEEKDAVLKFIGTAHAAKDTKERIQALRQSEVALNEINGLLIKLKIFPEFRDEAAKLCGRCKEQEIYIRDMDKRLSDDLNEQHRIEDKKSLDLIKNVTFLFAIPAGFVTGVKNGFGAGVVSPYEAGGAGFVVSLAALSHKSLIKGFRSAGKSLLQTPQQIRDSFTLYYIREIIRQKSDATIKRLNLNNSTKTAGL